MRWFNLLDRNIEQETERKIEELSSAWSEATKEGWKELDKAYGLSKTFENGQKYKKLEKAFKVVANRLIQVKPELRGWLEKYYGEYL